MSILVTNVSVICFFVDQMT